MECGCSCAHGRSIGGAGASASGAICCQGCAGCTGVGCCHAAAHKCCGGFSGVFIRGRDSPCGLECGCSCTHGRSIGDAGASASGAICCQGCAGCTGVGCCHAAAHICRGGFSGAFNCGRDSPCGLECGCGCDHGRSIGNAGASASGAICCQGCAGCTGVGCCHAAAHICRSGFSGVFTCGRDSPCGLECGCGCDHGRSIGGAGASASGAICCQGCAGCTGVGCCHAAAHICCGGFSGVFIRGRDSPCGLECGCGCDHGRSIGGAGASASGDICCQGCAGCTGVGCCHAAAHICRSGFSGVFACGHDSPCGLECGCGCAHGRSIGDAGASASGAICCQGCAGCTGVGCCHAAAHKCCGGFSGVFIRGRDSPCGLECGWGCADGCSVGDAGDTASGAICCQGCAGCTGVGCCHAAAHICRGGFSGVFTCGRDSPCGLECGCSCTHGRSIGNAGASASGAICCQGCAGCTGVGCCHAAAHICCGGL